jgi:hypothetical protein
MPVFKTGAFNRSATSPGSKRSDRSERRWPRGQVRGGPVRPPRITNHVVASSRSCASARLAASIALAKDTSARQPGAATWSPHR